MLNDKNKVVSRMRSLDILGSVIGAGGVVCVIWSQCDVCDHNRQADS